MTTKAQYPLKPPGKSIRLGSQSAPHITFLKVILKYKTNTQIQFTTDIVYTTYPLQFEICTLYVWPGIRKHRGPMGWTELCQQVIQEIK